MYRNGLKNRMQGYNTRFSKGHIPSNKGKKGEFYGGEETWFKKGHLPASYKPIGSEATRDGITYIKVDDPNVWMPKHRYILEQQYGEIPEDKVIRFKDGDKTNVTIDNLFITSRRAMTSVTELIRTVQ